MLFGIVIHQILRKPETLQVTLGIRPCSRQLYLPAMMQSTRQKRQLAMQSSMCISWQGTQSRGGLSLQQAETVGPIQTSSRVQKQQ